MNFPTGDANCTVKVVQLNDSDYMMYFGQAVSSASSISWNITEPVHLLTVLANGLPDHAGDSVTFQIRVFEPNSSNYGDLYRHDFSYGSAAVPQAIYEKLRDAVVGGNHVIQFNLTNTLAAQPAYLTVVVRLVGLVKEVSHGVVYVTDTPGNCGILDFFSGRCKT